MAKVKPLVWYKKVEIIIGLAAMVASLVAVFIGVYAAYLDRESSRADVWPRIEIDDYFNDSLKKPSQENESIGTKSKYLYKFSLVIENVGTGPALIKYTNVTYKSKAIKTWQELYKVLGYKSYIGSYNTFGDRVLATQSNISILDAEAKPAKSLNDSSDLLDIEICYCSVFDDCWLSSLHGKTLEVKSCPLNDKDNFLQ